MREIKSLTGLRFIAAFAVVLHHTYPATAPVLGEKLLWAAGPWAMTIFFMLSGFVLTWVYGERFRERRPWRDFAVARFARIYPVFVLLLCIDVRLSGTGPNVLHGGVSDFVAHLLLIQSWTPVANSANYLYVAWSLSVELLFYLSFPFLIVWVMRLSRRGLWLLAGGSVAVTFGLALAAHIAGADALPLSDSGSAYMLLYHFAPARLPDFVLGCCVGRLYMLGMRAPRGGTLALGASLFLAGAALTPALDGANSYSALGLDAVFVIPAAYALLSFASNRSRVLASGPLLALGAASYSLYLVHPMVATVAGRLEYVASPIATILLAVLTSLVLYRIVEVPARQAIRGSQRRVAARHAYVEAAKTT